MGKLVVSLDGVVIKEVQITKDKTSLGRRPYNDIVIDNLAVSGEHAVLQMVGADVFIEDLNSTNGTYINGRAVKKQLLQHNDTVEIGKYKIKYLLEEAPDFEKTMVIRPGAAAPAATRPMPAVAPGMGPGPAAAPLGAGPAASPMSPRPAMPAHAPSMAPGAAAAATGAAAAATGAASSASGASGSATSSSVTPSASSGA